MKTIVYNGDGFVEKLRVVIYCSLEEETVRSLDPLSSCAGWLPGVIGEVGCFDILEFGSIFGLGLRDRVHCPKV